MQDKQCSLCGERKSLDAFHRNQRTKDGYNAACTQCKRARLGTGKPHRSKIKVPDGFKQCSQCGEVKSFEHFYHAVSSKDGYRPSCKECVAESADRAYRPVEKLPDGQKRCSMCRQVFPATATYFKLEGRRSSGLANLCRPCAVKTSKDWYKRKVEAEPDYPARRHTANREYSRTKSREWYQNNKQRHQTYGREWRKMNAEKVKEKGQEYYRQNQQRYIQKSRRWRRENPERYREYNQQWLEDNPQKATAIRKKADSRRRTRKRGLPFEFAPADWLFCLEYWDNTCAICGSKGNLDADHWIALSREDCPGTVVENMICLCDHCNSTKHARYPEDWLIETLGEQLAREKMEAVNTYFEFIKTLKSIDEE